MDGRNCKEYSTAVKEDNDDDLTFMEFQMERNILRKRTDLWLAGAMLRWLCKSCFVSFHDKN